ncbi:MAG: prealbumin-like fold domain-containing protein, partial [Oscillospiraceae bacterium]
MKLDENGKALSGALFGLFRSDAVEFTEEGALMTATSGEDGVFVFENLPVGDYIVHELTAPAGYVLSEELHQVSIAENAQVIE